MAAPKLEWKVVRKLGSHDSHLLATVEDWTNSRKYDIKFEFTENGEPRFVAFWTNRINAQHFISVDDAKAWCQARENEAYAAANPAREFTNAEILDCLEGEIECYRSTDRSEWLVCGLASNKYFSGNTRREAVSAYLRANPPATEPEPSPDREMTLREFEETCLAKGMKVTFDPDRSNKDANIWVDGNSTETDTYAPTLAEALAKCLAAIEAAKARNA